MCDLADRERTARVIQGIRPDVVIHTQALSDVDLCEREPSLAMAMNVDTTANVVWALQNSNTWLLNISTDYVFDGCKGLPYEEGDIPHPLSVYGTSKLESERIALQYPRALVIRPSTLFGPDRFNFCDHVRACLRSGQSVEAFVDQTTSPTFTLDLAEAVAGLLPDLSCRMQESLSSRLLHMANTGFCTRLEFAYRIADLMGVSRTLVRSVRLAEAKRSARRPAYSALTTTQLPRWMGRTLRSWDDALQAYLQAH